MARPRCPQHPASRVWFDGTYGAAGRKRQRLHCVDGGHVFTEPLPRQKTDHRDCVECERSLAQHEGPAAPREQLYTVREVTRALMRVGEGWTYRGVGRLLRTDANRMKKTATGIEYASRDSSVVEDWIEIFAPVIFERYAPKEWPPLVMLDDLPFLVRVPGTTHKRVAFRVFAALGFWPNGRRRLLRLEAFADKTPANWAQFLTAIGGRPCGIICDNESGMLKGIEQVWPHTAADPAPIVWLSHWHVGNALLKLLRRYKRLTQPLSDALQDAFMGTTEWQAFDTLARQSHFPELVNWLDNPAPLSWWAGDLTMSERILWQLERRRGIPSTTTALEQHLLVIKEKLNKRKFVFRNRERTNRMVMILRAAG